MADIERATTTEVDVHMPRKAHVWMTEADGFLVAIRGPAIGSKLIAYGLVAK